MSEERSEPKLVRDLMSVGVLTCGLRTPVIELTRALLEKELEAAVVLDEQGNAAGFVGQDELVRAYAQGTDADGVAETIMREDVPQVPPDIPLAATAQIMQDQKVRVLFIMHHAGGIEYPAAMLSYKHFLRHITMTNEADLRDLGIKAERESPLATFFKRRDEARQRAEGNSR